MATQLQRSDQAEPARLLLFRSRLMLDLRPLLLCSIQSGRLKPCNSSSVPPKKLILKSSMSRSQKDALVDQFPQLRTRRIGGDLYENSALFETTAHIRTRHLLSNVGSLFMYGMARGQPHMAMCGHSSVRIWSDSLITHPCWCEAFFGGAIWTRSTTVHYRTIASEIRYIWEMPKAH